MAAKCNSVVSPHITARSRLGGLKMDGHSVLFNLSQVHPPQFQRRPPVMVGIGASSPVQCKAVSVKPQTEIEGLNIAEDVTQVNYTGD